MNKEQLTHYLKGGIFTGVYKPKKLDISTGNKMEIGKQLKFHQNMIIVPLQFDGHSDWKDQYAFNADEISGWLPEEDIDDLKIIDEFIENIEPMPVHVYCLTYTDRNSLIENFGNAGRELPLPYKAYRSYSTNMDYYILIISNPKADTITKALYDETGMSEWEQIYPEKQVVDE